MPDILLPDSAGGDHAHSGAYVAPFIVVPPVFTNALSVAAHQTANRAFGMRFNVPVERSYRYARFHIGLQSGNIQAAVVKRDAGSLVNFTRVMDSGIIACPAAASIRLDLGATLLAPGDHWLCFWADNTTVTTYRTDLAAAAFGTLARLNSNAAGIPATGTWDTVDGTWVVAMSLEATTP